jgi:YbbR domain-containing protein
VSETARIWGLRLLALLIAVALWYSVSLEDRETLAERIVEASVSYNQPRGLVILDQVQNVKVRLRGTSRKIRRLNPLQVYVQVDLTREQAGEADITLGPDDVQVPEEGLEVVSVDPNVIRVELDAEVTQGIPVEIPLVGKPPEGFTVGELEVLPNQVFVTGPKSLVAQLTVLRTRPLTLTGRTRSFEETVSVVAPPDPLIQVLQRSRVNVRVPVIPPAAEPPGTEATEPTQPKGRP